MTKLTTSKRRVKGQSGVHLMEQKETENPPPVPNVTGGVVLRGTTTTVSLSNVSNLWPSGSTDRSVLVVPVPSSTDVIAFGQCQVGINDDILEVAFVALIAAQDYEDFTDRMDSESVPVVEDATPDQESIQTYMANNFGSLALAKKLEGNSSNDERFIDVA
jgi:hypothetical protein